MSGRLWNDYRHWSVDGTYGRMLDAARSACSEMDDAANM